MNKSINDINERIADGSVRVVTAEEMPDIVDELGVSEALREVDVVTTGTFGAMCSSGAFLNFGHPKIPIRMESVWLNDVEAYAGIAAVDCYLGATQESITRGSEYGGAHVIEDLISGRSVELRAKSKGTDCYPLQSLSNEFTLSDINQAIMVNPRNSYQCYNAATNMGDHSIKTYMGYLLPNHRNITYSGAGALSPLPNDPTFSVIGSGTPIFLGGANGMVIGEGTQHSPYTGFGTLMTTCDMKGMSTDYVRAATMTGYGVTMYIGVGIPIPLINEEIVRHTSVRDEELVTNIVDYGTPFRDRPIVRQVTYAELKSGKVEIDGEVIRASPLSSYKKAREVAMELKRRVEVGAFMMALATHKINTVRRNKPMVEHKPALRVRDVMVSRFITIFGEESVKEAACRLLKEDVRHLLVIDSENRLIGIVTPFDISKAVSLDEVNRKISEIMTCSVITALPDEPVDLAVRRLQLNNIRALVVIDTTKKVLGMLNSSDLTDFLRMTGRHK